MTTSTSRYLPHGPFFNELRTRVDAYFAASGRAANATPPGMFLKTAVILTWFVASWVAMVFLASNAWQLALACISLGLASAGIGFSIQHDGGHTGYSQHRWLNRLMASTLDLLGGSSYLWHWKHNIVHHSHTNITGLDMDIDLTPLARMSPAQERRKAHRFQHLYIWPLYCFLAVKWHFVDDYKNLLQGRFGEQHFPRPKGWRLFGLISGKVIFATWAFGIPLLMMPWWQVLLCYALWSATLSLMLSITFQLAHCVEGTEFPLLDLGTTPKMEWAVHQVVTSANFGLKNRLLTWYVGGLNYQIEHHLFPKVCSYRLPEIAPIVQRLCAEQGIPYIINESTLGAIGSHARWVRSLGQPAATA